MTALAEGVRGRWGAGPGALVTAVVVYAAVFAWGIVNLPYDLAGALVIGPLLLVTGVPILKRVMRDEIDPRLERLVIAAYFIKLGGSVGRYFVEFDIYGGADAGMYHRTGAAIAEGLRSGRVEFATDTGLIGTEFIRVVTGVVYTITDPTRLGGFLVFAVIAFTGQFLAFRAFRLSVPDGNAVRYAALVLLFPSLLFWPSAIGKDAWMIFGLGLVAYGAARMLTDRSAGTPLAMLGLLATGIVRPHVALIAAAALAGAYLVTFGRRMTAMTARPVGTTVAMIALIVGSAAAAAQVEAMFGLETLDVEGVEQALDRTVGQTTRGGSAFDVEPGFRPWLLPVAAVSVLFRPFPWEAHNAQALLQSLEGVLLLGLVILWRRELRYLWGRIRNNPYLTFVALFSLLFVLAFANIANFGILARQRTQVLPFVLALLAAGTWSVRDGPEESEDTVESPSLDRA